MFPTKESPTFAQLWPPQACALFARVMETASCHKLYDLHICMHLSKNCIIIDVISVLLSQSTGCGFKNSFYKKDRIKVNVNSVFCNKSFLATKVHPEVSQISSNYFTTSCPLPKLKVKEAESSINIDGFGHLSHVNL